MSSLSYFLTSALAFLAALFPSAATAPSGLASIFSPPSGAHVAVLFGGDMMFDRTIRRAIDEKGGDFIFSCIDEILKDADLVVANLEGPITDNPSTSMNTAPGADGNYTFTFPTSTASLLFAHNIRMVNIGNNHIENFGLDGVRSTMSALADTHVGYFGDPIDRATTSVNINDVHFAFINYNEFGGDASTTILQIQDAHMQGKFPIVYTHWGIEYATTSPEYVRALAHTFVDAGAEIVIGSHPHVVQEREYYREKYIYYSLGNLIFDQYWSDDVRRGLMVRVVFDGKGVQYVEEIPVELLRDRRTCLK